MSVISMRYENLLIQKYMHVLCLEIYLFIIYNERKFKPANPDGMS